ncbi:hypothetical protein ACDZ28_10815 [Paenibacillus sp. RS8]|uniref:hypothetical protein n=1 Tax=Paenibacillus sp. RS8 TaxID=3242681 RepID=UPI0035C069E8
MKKKIIGLVMAALFLGSSIGFAAGSTLLGSKVTGIYTVEQDGKKIADAAIINGSAYVPVRAMSEATGTDLNVDGKKIIMESKASATINVVAQIEKLQYQRAGIIRKIETAEGGVKLYETDIIPRAEENARITVGSDMEQSYANWLAGRTAERDQYKQDIITLQQQLADIDAQIAELQK